MLWGLTQHVDSLSAALGLEEQNLSTRYGIGSNEYHSIDGSGGGDTTATNAAVTQMLFRSSASTARSPS